MQKKIFFHLNCLTIIPDCGFQCNKCVDEIGSVLKANYPVSEVTLVEVNNISAISVEYDPAQVRINDLHNELENLPSFYTDKFVPTVLEE
jgi:copper chaperone CopZ